MNGLISLRLLVAITICSMPAFAAAPTSSRALLQNSVKNVPAAALSPAGLTAADAAEPMEFMVALKMRDFSELISRINNGELISHDEMAKKYYPLDADYQAVVDWLSSQGFAITDKDQNRLGVFVSATVSQIEQALQVSFGKVTADGKTYISAITAPSLPVFVASAVVGVNGLQPQIRPHTHSRRLAAAPVPATANHPPFLPSEMLKAYGGNGLSVDGTGQKIGIVIDTFPNNGDLTSFWSQAGVAQSVSNMEYVQVVSGFLPFPSGEESLDVEWSSGIAAGAKVRVYATRDLAFVHIDQAYQRIINDLPSQPQLHQVSLSFGLGELYASGSQMQTDAQYFASMASGGVTVFVSSGDGGSSPGPGGHDHSGATQTETPASDPSVTAVGGTSIYLNSANGSVSSESAWFDGGGALSAIFNRPAWQTGAGLPAGTKRAVPDVASAADQNTGGLLILNGSTYQAGGTSWSAPMWAGFCALINQARANAGQQPLGLLGPKIYPLLGSANFRDITTGNNGGYSAGPGYDLCTGVGVPNVSALLQTLSSGGAPTPTPTPTATPTPTPTPTPVPAGIPQMITPVPGSTFASSSVTFTWTKGAAIAYRLYVGNSAGGSDIYNSGQTRSKSITVNNIPTDGRPIYVQLTGLIGGQWYSPQNYTYTAFSNSPTPTPTPSPTPTPTPTPTATPTGAVATPAIAPNGGRFIGSATVSLTCQTSQATIYYTTDGSNPTTASSVYPSAFTLTQSATVKARAVKSGYSDSAIASASFTIR